MGGLGWTWARLRMLEDQIARWRSAQPLHATGPLVAASGGRWRSASRRDQGGSGWSGWLTPSGSLAFLVGYARFGDIPPFVFYLLLPAVSLGW